MVSGPCRGGGASRGLLSSSSPAAGVSKPGPGQGVVSSTCHFSHSLGKTLVTGPHMLLAAVVPSQGSHVMLRVPVTEAEGEADLGEGVQSHPEMGYWLRFPESLSFKNII